MGPATTEQRVLMLRNNVMPQRSRSPSKISGKTKKWHWTKDHLRQAMSRFATWAASYPTSLTGASTQAVLSPHEPPDFLCAADDATAKAHPHKRKQYSASAKAKELVIPKKGKMYTRDPYVDP